MDLSFLKKFGVKSLTRALLADYTTFKLGGPCDVLIPCANAEQVSGTVKALRTRGFPFIVMGFGSNILTSDDGVNTVILRYSSDAPLIEREHLTLTVDAGTQFDALAEYAVNAGLEGMTTFSGIPGTVGGAIAGNAGAYGNQISDTLVSLTLLNPDSSIITTPKADIHFEYRDSDLKHNGTIILSAVFKLSVGDAAEMRAKRAELIQTRESKHGRWQDNPCAGSFFRNVEPTSKAGPRQSAGWFIEQTGANRYNINGAHAYAKHANILTRDDGATAQSVYTLAEKMIEEVKDKFGIELVREVRLLGAFNGIGNAKGYW